MRAHKLLRTLSRSSNPRRKYTTSPLPDTTTLESTLRQTLLARPPHIIHDYLSPTNSHLLSLTLASFLPPPTFPQPPPHLPGRHDELPLPQGHHLVYFPTPLPSSSLLPDGTDDLHSPGAPFTRRLWGGGSLVFNTERKFGLDLDGTRAVCIERITDVIVKGREGQEKVVVDVERRVGLVGRKLTDRLHDAFDEEWPVKMEERVRELEQDGLEGEGVGGLGVVERRRLVFLREGEKVEGGRVVNPAQQPDFEVKITPTRHLLFRFSALSFNAHSIHLDSQYTKDVEGYRDLLVHGPLTLVLMLEVLKSQLQPGEMIARFDYRNLAPLIVGEECKVCVKKGEGGGKWDVWIVGREGGLAVRGKAVVGTVDGHLLEEII